MNETTGPEPLRTVIGRNLRTWRQGEGRLQDEIARTMTALGCPWTRSIVAAIENGRRQVAFEELVALAELMECSPRDLLQGDGEVIVCEGASRSLDYLRGFLSTKRASALEHVDLEAASDEDAADLLRVAFGGPGGAEIGEAERVAARRLGTSPTNVNTIAHARWGKSFTARRDELVAEETAEGASPRTVQAVRGHVTRRLYEEIRGDVPKSEEQSDG